jgi:hypothetical protein
MSNAHRLEPRLESAAVPADSRKDTRVTAGLPTLAGARKRLEAAKSGGQPWLTPAGLRALRGKAEVLGPKTYRKK